MRNNQNIADNPQTIQTTFIKLDSILVFGIDDHRMMVFIRKKVFYKKTVSCIFITDFYENNIRYSNFNEVPSCLLLFHFARCLTHLYSLLLLFVQWKHFVQRLPNVSPRTFSSWWINCLYFYIFSLRTKVIYNRRRPLNIRQVLAVNNEITTITWDAQCIKNILVWFNSTSDYFFIFLM